MRRILEKTHKKIRKRKGSKWSHQTIKHERKNILEMKDTPCTYNVTPRRVRVTVAMEKQ
jgi:hypothetical protein